MKEKDIDIEELAKKGYAATKRLYKQLDERGIMKVEDWRALINLEDCIFELLEHYNLYKQTHNRYQLLTKKNRKIRRERNECMAKNTRSKSRVTRSKD